MKILNWVRRRTLEIQRQHYLIAASNLSDQIRKDSQMLAQVHRQQALITSQLHELRK